MPDRISRYDLLNRLGTGGMGTVWRARDVRNGSEVAIKVLHQHLAADADDVRRFQREARVAASIDSPNVVKVLDSGRDGDSYFLVMEYVLGHTLSQEIQARHRFTIEDSVAIAVSVAQGLLAAQAVGVVHRDISPQNVIIANDGTVKITDFGIARDLGATAMTATSMILGKPQYLAPEVATGHGQADIRSDIYALGVTLFQMLTGQVPFDAVTPFDVLKMQVDQAPPDLQALRPEVPPWLAGVVQKCLAKSPEERFQTPRELLLALGVDRVVPVVHVATPSRRKRTILVGGAFIGVALVAAIIALASVARSNHTRLAQAQLSTPSPTLSAESAIQTPSGLESPSPVSASPEATSLAVVATNALNRQNCAAIRGTAYLSSAERTWFQENCDASTVAVPSSAPTASPSLAAVAPTSTPSEQSRPEW